MTGGVQFASLAELLAETPPEPEWVWEGYAARGVVTLIAGKPKVGKSTLVWGLVEAVATEAPSFVGHRIVGGPVVCVSEESATTLRSKLSDDGRAASAIRVLTRDAWPKPTWATLIGAAAAEARRVGAALFVVDTFAWWASLAPEREKDAGSVQAAMSMLTTVARDGVAVVVVHHQRKGAGENGEAVRGSSAIAATVDAIVELERPAGEPSPRRRQIAALGRWPQTPGLVLVDHDATTNGWRVIAEGESRNDSSRLSWRERVLAALAGGADATYDVLADRLDADKRKFKGVLDELVEQGCVDRSGTGKKGEPFRFRLARQMPSADSVPSSTERDAEMPSGVSVPAQGRKGTASTAGFRPCRLPYGGENGRTESQPPTCRHCGRVLERHGVLVAVCDCRSTGDPGRDADDIGPVEPPACVRCGWRPATAGALCESCEAEFERLRAEMASEGGQ